MFAKILNPDKLDDLIGASTAKSLALIGRLKQLCNSPVLLRSKSDEKEEIQSTANTAIKNALGLLPESAQMDDMTLSGILRIQLSPFHCAHGSCSRQNDSFTEPFKDITPCTFHSLHP
jgi:hypothetical protein